MTYHFSKTIDMRFDDAVVCTKEALKRHKLTVLSEIDMKDTLNKAINIDFHPYLILGVCNPQLTYRALQAEDKIGAMLPCNTVLQQRDDGRVDDFCDGQTTVQNSLHQLPVVLQHGRLSGVEVQ